MRVVVIGGFGNFGARICRTLTQVSGVEVIATSRRTRSVSDAAHAASIDIDAPGFAAALSALAPDIVIHCAGPFQGQDYRVAEATLSCGAHYIDLADGREFVTNFAAHNHVGATFAQRAAISGASTLPALSSAVVDNLKDRFTRIEEIDIAIAPGQQAPRGAATIAAVLGYAGRPFPWLQNGVWRTAYGWQELRRVRFPFGRRYAAACDVPDLTLLPQRYAGVLTVAFRAALEVPLQHYALWSVAAMRRIGVRLPLERWAASLNRASTWLDRFGSDCGGMRVSVAGPGKAGGKRRATWYLVAKDNRGPEIPCLAAILLTCKLAAGEAIAAGARPCVGLLALSDFLPEFERWDISTWIDEMAA